MFIGNEIAATTTTTENKISTAIAASLKSSDAILETRTTTIIINTPIKLIFKR